MDEAGVDGLAARQVGPPFENPSFPTIDFLTYTPYFITLLSGHII